MVGPSGDFSLSHLYLDKVQSAIEQIGKPATAEALLTLVQLNTAGLAAREWIGAVSPKNFETMVWLGHKADALICARQKPYPSVADLEAIYKALEAKGQPDPSLLNELWNGAHPNESPSMRAYRLCDLAELLIKSGDSRVDEALEEALNAAREIQPLDNGQYDSAYLEIAHAFAAAGRFDDILQIALDENADDDRADMVRIVIRGRAQAHQFEEALELANGLSSPGAQCDAFIEIAAAMADVDPTGTKTLLDRAKALARRSGLAPTWLTAKLPGPLAKAGYFDEAITVAQENPNPWILIEVITIALEKDYPLIEQFLSFVSEQFQKVEQKRQYGNYSAAIKRLMVALIRNGYVATAFDLIDLLQSDTFRVEILLAIARGVDQSSDKVRYIDLARKSAIRLSPVPSRLLSEIALMMAQLEDPRAEGVCMEAIGRQINYNYRGVSAETVAFALHLAGRPDLAKMI